MEERKTYTGEELKTFQCVSKSYMAKVLHRLHEEHNICKKFLHPSSHEKVRQLFYKHMVAHQMAFFRLSCKEIVGNEQHGDIKNMFRLLKNVTAGPVILVQKVESHMTNVVANTLKTLRQDHDQASLFIRAVCNAQKKSATLIEDLFQEDPLFTAALHNAWRAGATNSRSDISREWLLKFLDHLLKKGKKETWEVVTEKVQQFIKVFKCLEDNDTSKQYYTKALSNRLMQEQTEDSLKIEEKLISLLKETYGSNFTGNMQTMCKDIGISIELMPAFSKYCTRKWIELEVDVDVKILRSHAWPLQKTLPSFAVPEQLEDAARTFGRYMMSPNQR